MLRILKIILLLVFYCTIQAQETPNLYLPVETSQKVVLLMPTGEKVNDLPVMRKMPDSLEVYMSVVKNIEESFIDQILDIYHLTQVYLLNKQQLETIEPAYLALTENQGGFAKFGFILQEGDQYIEKAKTPYIDITLNQASQPPEKLMSITQLYPHEMGHVLIHLLCKEDSVESNTKSVDMHFFSIVTDYSTAFNEGFAEHIENVSRTYEQNEAIVKGIEEDLVEIAKNSERAIKGFDRDFKYPFRLGFYKGSMIMWYQKFEDYKRYEFALNGNIQYKNSAFSKGKVKDRLSYRKSGVHIDWDEKRNYVQLLSTEGAVSAFFSKLSASEVIMEYQEKEFYEEFYLDSALKNTVPEEIFTPLQNQFLKYIKVLDKYVVFNNSQEAQLIDFIEGYNILYPNETKIVDSLFKASLGMEYSKNVPPPLWILVKGFDHRLVVFDLFGALSIPLYSFDLNAAEVEDLMTIKGVSESDAELIIKHRKNNGFFNDWHDLMDVKELSEYAREKIISSAFDKDHAEQILTDFEPQFNLFSFIVKPIVYILKRAGIYFLIFMIINYFFFFKAKIQGIITHIFLFLRYLFMWLSFVFLGLFCLLIGSAAGPLIFSICSIIIAFTGFLVFRKNKEKRNRSVLMIAEMFVLVLISVI